jgi:hypothetical protein
MAVAMLIPEIEVKSEPAQEPVEHNPIRWDDPADYGRQNLWLYMRDRDERLKRQVGKWPDTRRDLGTIGATDNLARG